MIARYSPTQIALQVRNSKAYTIMNRRFFILLSAVVITCSTAFSQVVGSWKTYFSYNQMDQIADGGECIYALGNGNLFALNKEYESLETFSKTKGMNDNDIAIIKFSKSLNTLFIAYNNCNIDLLKDGRFYNIPDLKRKSITNKAINNISFNNHFAYLSCSFGIMVVNMQKQEIADTYIIGPNGTYSIVYACYVLNENIYALTEQGLYKAKLNGTNLSDYSNWSGISLPEKGIREMACFNNDLVILNNGRPCRYNNGEWTELCEEGNFSNITVNDNTLTCFGREGFASFGNDWNINEKQSLTGIKDMISYGKTHWITLCDNEECALTKWTDNEMVNQYRPEGPYSSSVAFAKMRNGKIITGSGGPFDRAMNTPGVIQIYENGKWTTIRDKDVQEILPGRELYDVLDAEIDPADPRRFYAATWRGLFEFYDNKIVNVYFNDNSNLENVNEKLLLVDGLCFDKKNNLWMTNMNAKDVIKVKKTDGTWASLFYDQATNKPTTKELFIDSRGMKWVLSPRGNPGVLVVNDNNTPFNSSDDNSRWFNMFNEYSTEGATPITTAIYRSIAEDKNGAIWIGTEKGPLIINNPEKIFSENFYVERIKITREDNALFADYLLANEQIEAICVDGANRKWIGTTLSGVFLLSEDGQETIHHFTMDNSPLTSNSIIDISLDPKTGEVLIATSNGLFSYMSDAIEGSESFSDAYAFPNPVKQDYSGPIYIKGLMENSVIKIADIEGNVVSQGVSNGGIYSWDGTRLGGRRVNTGIYLVFMALPDGSEKEVTKIAIIN